MFDIFFIFFKNIFYSTKIVHVILLIFLAFLDKCIVRYAKLKINWHQNGNLLKFRQNCRCYGIILTGAKTPSNKSNWKWLNVLCITLLYLIRWCVFCLGVYLAFSVYFCCFWHPFRSKHIRIKRLHIINFMSNQIISIRMLLIAWINLKYLVICWYHLGCSVPLVRMMMMMMYNPFCLNWRIDSR